MGRPKIYADRSEQNRAQYCRDAGIQYQLVEGYVVRLDKVQHAKRHITPPANEIIAEVVDSPDLKDTVSWSMEDWMKTFQSTDTLLPHQVENQQAITTYDRGMIRDPRQHGKTNYVLKPLMLRRLCETQFTGPKSLIYASHSYSNSVNMTMVLREELIQNPAILQNYGLLIDYATYKQSRLKKQTQHILNLIGQRKTSHSFQGISTGQGIRGTSGIDECYIDDPIDLEKEEEYVVATKKFLNWYKFKIMPFCRGGKIWLIGTRYGVRDLYMILGDEKIYYEIERAALKHPILPFKINYPKSGKPLRASHIELADPDQWQLLAPELWSMQTYTYNGTPAQNIAYEIHSYGNRAAQQELMNNPLPLDPLVKWEWLHHYERLYNPDWMYNWAVMVDVAAGESEGADYTAMVLVAAWENKFYIHDILFGKWTGKEKQERLENFIISWREKLHTKVRIKVLIETVMNQRDFFQRIRDESFLIPKAISPSKRRDKLTRITHGLGQEMENGQVFLHQFSRNIPQFHIEIDGFPKAKEDHILDAVDQCVHYLKRSKTKIKAGWL
jgi:predicted phage terminase large subunit-like protein